LVSIWDPEQPSRGPADLPPELLEELSALRADLAELAERVDFAERLLASSRQEDGRVPSSLKA
jgi:hypothetical protein